jgi:hypothetical protein
MAALLACLVLLACSSPSPAVAMPGPGTLQVGVVDDGLFESPLASLRTEWFGRSRALGADWVRLTVPWATIAPAKLSSGFNASDPADPHYYFAYIDAAVRSAQAAGEKLLMMIDNPPTWALGQNPPPGTPADTYEPSATDLGAFTRALALRYDGGFPDPLNPGKRLPRVSAFQIFNEVNSPTELSPQWTSLGNGQYAPAAPALYRDLLNAAYGSIKTVQPHALLMAAGFTPYGDPPGGFRMHPVAFLRALLCLDDRLQPLACANPAHLDAIDFHPYSITPTVHAFNRDDVSVPDAGRLRAVLRAAERTHRLLPGGPKPIWETEIFWQSNPPDPAVKVSLATQARYLALTFYELWRTGVNHVFWFTIQDYPALFPGAGVYYANGRAKPSATALRFPFVALPGPRRSRSVTLWGRAPSAGVVSIERATRHGYRRLFRLRTTRGGVFYARRRLAGHPALRAVIGHTASLRWSGG